MAYASLEWLFEEVGYLTDDTAAEGKYADDKNNTLNNGDPGTLLGQIVLHSNDYSGTYNRAEDGAQPP